MSSNLLIKFISAGLSVFILSFLIYLSGSVTEYLYYLKHPLSVGEEDLGVGLIMILWAIIAFPVAIILYFPLYRFVLNQLKKMTEKNNVI